LEPISGEPMQIFIEQNGEASDEAKKRHKEYRHRYFGELSRAGIGEDGKNIVAPINARLDRKTRPDGFDNSRLYLKYLEDNIK
jgi:hypothetical protein